MQKNQFSVGDYVVFGLMLVISAAIGFYFAWKDRRKQNTTEFLLGNRTLQIFPVAMSILASFTSAVSILGFSQGTQVFYPSKTPKNEIKKSLTHSSNLTRTALYLYFSWKKCTDLAPCIGWLAPHILPHSPLRHWFMFHSFIRSKSWAHTKYVAFSKTLFTLLVFLYKTKQTKKVSGTSFQFACQSLCIIHILHSDGSYLNFKFPNNFLASQFNSHLEIQSFSTWLLFYTHRVWLSNKVK